MTSHYNSPCWNCGAIPTTWDDNCHKCGLTLLPRHYDPIWHEVEGGVCLIDDNQRQDATDEEYRIAFIGTNNMPKVLALSEEKRERILESWGCHEKIRSAPWITSSCDFGSDERASRDFCTQQLIRLGWAPESPRKPRDYYVEAL